MKITLMSWNVNGIRAVSGKGFYEWLDSGNYDIIGIQETKASPGQLTPELLNPRGYTGYWNAAQRKGYSGTALLTKKPPKEVKMGFGIPRFDDEGRVIEADYGDFVFINIYYPNGQQDEERLKYKMEFYDAFLEYAGGLKKAGRNLIVTGDVNTAHREIDLANPKANEKYSGFLPMEREWIDKFLSHGYIDTFRHFHPDDPGRYTWWTYRFNARANNVGWRIDYFFVNKEFLPHVKDSFIQQDVTGSDHCPIGLTIEI